MAKDLVAVLAGANQPIDDWLSREADRALNTSLNSTLFNGYSSRDIRRGDGRSNEAARFVAPPPPEEEECWD